MSNIMESCLIKLQIGQEKKSVTATLSADNQTFRINTGNLTLEISKDVIKDVLRGEQ